MTFSNVAAKFQLSKTSHDSTGLGRMQKEKEWTGWDLSCKVFLLCISAHLVGYKNRYLRKPLQLRSWVQLPPGPFLITRELQHYFERVIESCRTKPISSSRSTRKTITKELFRHLRCSYYRNQ